MSTTVKTDVELEVYCDDCGNELELFQGRNMLINATACKCKTAQIKALEKQIEEMEADHD